MTRQEILAVAKPILFNTEMVRSVLDNRKTMTRRAIKPQPEASQDGMWHWKDCQWMDRGLGFPISAIQDYAPFQSGDYLYVRETWCELYHLADDMCTPVGEPCYYYAADGYNPTPFNSFPDDDGFFGDRNCPRWRPSIHMPKEATRIFLRVTGVRAERLQDITDKQIENEGIRAWSKDGVLYKYAPADREGDAPIWPWVECPRTPNEAIKRLWDTCYASPCPVKHNGIITHYESYPWENIRETRTHKRLPWKVYGNPWVWVIEFERMEANRNG